MKLIFQNDELIEFCLYDDPIAEKFKKMFKHLQHIPLNFKPWDNFYYKLNTPIEKHLENLQHFAKKLSIEIDASKCLPPDQDYFNYLHKVYEKNYDGNPEWLDFHEHIHMCERPYDVKSNYIITLDYREKAGPLIKPIDPDLKLNLKTKVKKGQIYTKWAELGKTPYNYFLDKEPTDIKRMCELIKPWTFLRPKIYIALEDYNFLDGKDFSDFEQWWANYKEEWCKYHNIEKYDVIDNFGVLPFGYVADFDKLYQLLNKNILPTRVVL